MDSKLQIISGMYRGRRLGLPPAARPTQNRARVALFNMLQSIGVMPKLVWDTFAGSGAFGMECLSRYADCHAVFTDVAASSINTVRKNLATLGASGRATALQTDALGAIAKYGAMADLIFLDPPYAEAELGAAFVRRAARVMRPGAILVWEQDAAAAVMSDAAAWEILRDKQYGRARFLILQRRDK